MDFSEYSFVLRHPLKCYPSAPCEAQPGGAAQACMAHAAEPPAPVGHGSSGEAHTKRVTSEAVGHAGGTAADAHPPQQQQQQVLGADAGGSRFVVVRPEGVLGSEADTARWRKLLAAAAALCTLGVIVVAAVLVMRAQGRGARTLRVSTLAAGSMRFGVVE